MKITLEVITPTKTVLKEEVDEITVSTVEGEISILPNHVDLLTKLNPGEMIIKNSGKNESFVVFGGFLEIIQNHVTILADHAVRASEIEVAKAQEAEERAKNAMKNKLNEQDFKVADANLRKALVELRVARKHKSARH